MAWENSSAVAAAVVAVAHLGTTFAQLLLLFRSASYFLVNFSLCSGKRHPKLVIFMMFTPKVNFW
jgi:hypothetical protein